MWCRWTAHWTTSTDLIVTFTFLIVSYWTYQYYTHWFLRLLADTLLCACHSSLQDNHILKHRNTHSKHLACYNRKHMHTTKHIHDMKQIINSMSSKEFKLFKSVNLRDILLTDYNITHTVQPFTNIMVTSVLHLCCGEGWTFKCLPTRIYSRQEWSDAITEEKCSWQTLAQMLKISDIMNNTV